MELVDLSLFSFRCRSSTAVKTQTVCLDFVGLQDKYSTETRSQSRNRSFMPVWNDQLAYRCLQARYVLFYHPMSNLATVPAAFQHTRVFHPNMARNLGHSRNVYVESGCMVLLRACGFPGSTAPVPTSCGWEARFRRIRFESLIGVRFERLIGGSAAPIAPCRPGGCRPKVSTRWLPIEFDEIQLSSHQFQLS